MHSIIIGIGNGIPILHIPYGECGRKRQMVRDMDLAPWLIDIDDEDAAQQMLDAALYADGHQAELRQHLAEVRERLVGLASQTCAKIRSIL